MKNDFDDLILQARKQQNDIENEKKKSRKMIDEDRIMKTKKMILRE